MVKQYVEMDHVATTLAVSPSGYLITIGTDERLVKVWPALSFLLTPQPT